MGSVVDFANTNFPDYDASGRAFSPATASIRGLAITIENAYPGPVDLAAEVARAEAVEAGLQNGIEIEIARAEQAEGDIQRRLDAEATTRDTQVKNLQNNIDIEVANAEARVSARIDATEGELADQAAASAAQLVDLRRTIALLNRPGDVPVAFTTDLAAGLSGVPSNAVVVVGPNGRVLRLPGIFVLAPSSLCPLEPNRTYKARVALRCSTDTTDPAGDAIRFAIAWYGSDGNLLALPLTDVATQRLTVAMGRVAYEVLISLAAPAAPIDIFARPAIQAPAGAAYCRPVLIGYGATPATDVEVLAAVDVSDAGTLSVDVDALNARLSAMAAALNLSI